MQPFTYQRARTLADATTGSISDQKPSPPTEAQRQYIAGGTNMTDYMKLGVMRPNLLVDINRVEASGIDRIEVTQRGLRLGALVRMSEAEDHDAIRADYPVIAQSLMLAASRQIRNMASLGGNILQRTRCEYFRFTSWPCNKRVPGTGCAALQGINREHAILGTSDACIATYHGDFAQALIALDASIEVAGGDGTRAIPFANLHLQPGTTPQNETTLAPGELITAIIVPAGEHTRRSRYVKVRDRASYQFALASAAVALSLDGDRVADARIALGGVATVPWRAREAERVLAGKPLDQRQAREAAEAALAGARPREHNAFKVSLGKETLVRALMEAKALQV